IGWQESVTFQDVAVGFTPEEWQLLDCNYRNLFSVGCPVTKTKVILKAEQEQEPWIVEGVNPHQSSPESDCPLVDEPGKHWESKDNFLKSVLLTFNKILTMERIHHYNMSTSLNPMRKKSYKSYEKHLPSNLDLLNYNRSYTGENTYECREWGKAFKKKLHFIKREKNHTRKKTF
uniref:KRAB domain-containing protein n=1 Tax=Aotus nancymaae TaxID=37293 RepID=A0A2K5F5P0_AOTNA